MAGFEFRKSLTCSDSAGTLELSYIINNSEVVTIGDAVKLDTNGHAILATAGSKVLGIVTGVVDEDGLAVDPDSGTLNTYTMESDNETDKKYKVKVNVDKGSLFANDASGSLATTNLLQFFDLTDEDTIDASSASDTAGQFQLLSLDPDGDADASKGLFRIAESQLDPYAQQ